MHSLSPAALRAARVGFAGTAFFAAEVLRANCGSAICPIDPQSMNLPILILTSKYGALPRTWC